MRREKVAYLAKYSAKCCRRQKKHSALALQELGDLHESMERAPRMGKLGCFHLEKRRLGCREMPGSEKAASETAVPNNEKLAG